ncbi:MAG: hypothetical protein ACFCUQ_12185 [Kiloniellales bacterium]
MALWKIVPVADPGEPRWLDHPIWAEVVVRAPTAALARVLAANMERRAMEVDAPAGNESHSFSSGFEDEKLYEVRRLEPRDEPALDGDGPEAVVRATKAFDQAAQ